MHIADSSLADPLDQGSVLAVRVFGSLSIYFTPQPEVVPASLSLYRRILANGRVD